MLTTDFGEVTHNKLRQFWLYVAPLPITLYAALRGWHPGPYNGAEIIGIDEAAEISPDLVEKLGYIEDELEGTTG